MSTIPVRSGDEALEGMRASSDRPLVAVAALYRFNGQCARISVHTPDCPVVPQNGVAVDSSGRWKVNLVSHTAVDSLLAGAARNGIKQLLKCVRCGGASAAARG
ncbi:hypothetical protein ACH4PU_31055 [Streptomyces sp. NPDC021100]|uniref:hypothetical protein n=1 Tax=Streptomyces sp. NPDC021100 TaxID=3365114 RepID=UPI003789983C